MKNIHPHHHLRGQALVTLLFFMIIATTITTAAVAVVLVNSLSATGEQQGTIALTVAESGAENALLRLLRDPNYSGETAPIGEGTAAITITGTNPLVITSVGTVGNFVRKVQVQAVYTNSVLSVSSWQEVY